MMKKEDLKCYENEKVFLKTTFGMFLTVDVTEVDDESLKGTDKYGKSITLCFDDIASVVPISDERKW